MFKENLEETGIERIRLSSLTESYFLAIGDFEDECKEAADLPPQPIE